MQTKFLALLAALFSVNATAQVVWKMEGGDVTKNGDTYVIRGQSGGDDFPRLIYVLPASCAGKKFTLSAEYKATGVKGGTASYHGPHFDFEIMAGGKQKWAPDFKQGSSDEFRSVKREWVFPPNMTDGAVRIGLQGVDGEMHVKNLQSSGC